MFRDDFDVNIDENRCDIGASARVFEAFGGQDEAVALPELEPEGPEPSEPDPPPPTAETERDDLVALWMTQRW